MIGHFLPDRDIPLEYFFETGWFGKQILMVKEYGTIRFMEGSHYPYPSYGFRKATEQEANKFMDRYTRKLGKETKRELKQNKNWDTHTCPK